MVGTTTFVCVCVCGYRLPSVISPNRTYTHCFRKRLLLILSFRLHFCRLRVVVPQSFSSFSSSNGSSRTEEEIDVHFQLKPGNHDSSGTERLSEKEM